MSELKWQLPVIQSNKTDHNWIHPKAKYHAYVNNNSVCGKYGQTTDYFATDLVGAITKEVACHRCLKKLNLF